MDIADVIEEPDVGEYILKSGEHPSVEEIDGKTMATELVEAGSDPGFFRLDADGNTEDELWEEPRITLGLDSSANPLNDD